MRGFVLTMRGPHSLIRQQNFHAPAGGDTGTSLGDRGNSSSRMLAPVEPKEGPACLQLSVSVLNLFPSVLCSFLH